VDHLFRDVDADRSTSCADQRSTSARRAASAAPYVEHAPRTTGGHCLDQQILEWLQCPIEQCLRLDPRAARAAVPELRLFVTSTLCGRHDRLLYLAFPAS